MLYVRDESLDVMEFRRVLTASCVFVAEDADAKEGDISRTRARREASRLLRPSCAPESLQTLLDSPTGDDAYEIPNLRFSMQGRDLLVVKVLNNVVCAACLLRERRDSNRVG